MNVFFLRLHDKLFAQEQTSDIVFILTQAHLPFISETRFTQPLLNLASPVSKEHP